MRRRESAEGLPAWEGPLAALLGRLALYGRFVPPPPGLLLSLSGLVVAYLASAELLKRWFFRRHA